MKNLILLIATLFTLALATPAQADSVRPEIKALPNVEIQKAPSSEPPLNRIGNEWYCTNWWWSDTGHTVRVKCLSGPPEKYYVKAWFCKADLSKCWWKKGDPVPYGTRAQVKSVAGSVYPDPKAAYVVAVADV